MAADKLIPTQCPICGDTKDISVPLGQYIKWAVHDEPIQYAMPQLSHDDRERLITGICPTCWDNELGGE